MKKQKKFPKIVKQLKNYLTDESGKITKHNALWIWAIGAVLWGFEAVDGHHHSSSYNSWWHTNSFNPANPVGGDNSTFYSSANCSTHSSGIRTGTYSDTIPLSPAGWYTATHNSGPHSWTHNQWFPNGNHSRNFYLDCWRPNVAINGHYSAYGATSASHEIVTHTSNHSNY